LILLVGAGAAFLEAFPRFAREQAIAAMPFVVLVVVYAISRFGWFERAGMNSSRRDPFTRQLAVSALLLLVVLVPGLRLFLETFFRDGFHFKSDTPVSVARAASVYFPEPRAREIEQVVEYIQRLVPEGGYVFAQSYAGSSFLFLADRQNPSGAQFWGGVGVTEAQKAETLRAIDELKVELIVTGDREIAAESYQPMRQYIEQHFGVTTRVGDVVLLERIDQGAI
jgi:hypothetical protein